VLHADELDRMCPWDNKVRARTNNLWRGLTVFGFDFVKMCSYAHVALRDFPSPIAFFAKSRGQPNTSRPYSHEWVNARDSFVYQCSHFCINPIALYYAPGLAGLQRHY